MTAFAMRNRVVVLTAIAILAIMGVQAFLTMSRREDPEIRIRVCVVVTEWPGASARKVEDLVTDPIEASLKDIDGVKEIRSKSRTSLSIINVELEDTINDVDQYWDEVRSKVDLVTPQLPDGVRTPRVDSDFGDVYSVALALYQTPAPGRDRIERPYDYRELEDFAETIQDELRGIPQVARVNIDGEQQEVVYLDINSRQWSKIGVTAQGLRNALEARNTVASGGEINTGTSRFTVKASGELESETSIADVVVARRNSLPVRIADLPISVRRDFVDPPRHHYRFHEPGFASGRTLLLAVSMRAGENVVEMGNAVRAKVRDLLRTTLPPDIELTVVNDLPRQVDDLVMSFIDNLWQAIVIVLFVALLIMGWRPSVVMAAAVPLSMIATIVVVRYFDVELEQFSIASLIIALGMLVDNAIVVSDNTLEELGKPDDASREQRVIRGARDLAIPILTSTLTTVSAFLPMLLLEGASGEYVRSLPIVVATTLGLSYIVAMTVTPIMCFWLLKPAQKPTEPGLTRRLVGRLRKRKPATPEPSSNRPGAYARLIRWCLNHKTVTLGSALVAVVASFSLVPLIGNQFFPGGVRDQFFVDVWLPEGSSIEATRDVCTRVEKIITDSSKTADGTERLKNCVTSVGGGMPRLSLTSDQEQALPNYGYILVNTTDANLSRPWVNEIAAAVGGIPGARIDVRAFMLGPAVDNPVEFSIVGKDHTVLREAADQIAEFLRKQPGTVNPYSDWMQDGYRVEVRVDQAKADLAGVTSKDVADTTNALISGTKLTDLREGDRQIPVMLRLDPAERRSALDTLETIYVNGASAKVPLASVAKVITSWEPAVVVREDTLRRITVGCQVRAGYLPNAVTSAARPGVEKIVAALPIGYSLEEGGEAKETSDANEQFSGVFQISFALILLVLIAQYNSILKPLIVLSTVPLALIGALLGLFVTGWPLGFMPSLGIISLAGVVINNAIILIDFIQTNARSGDPLHDCVVRAGSQRLRPIVLTTLTTVGGLLPLALLGGPMWAGMAWAMIFGLSLSTGLTLLVIPTLFVTCAEKLGMSVT